MSTQNDPPLSPLAEALGRRLEQLLEKGFHLPITGLSMDEFGNLMLWRYTQNGDAVEWRLLLEHLETAGIVPPVSIVLLDGTPGHVDSFVYGRPPRRPN
jgi:hypothetical protein